MNPCLTNFSKKIVTTGWIPKTMDRPVVAAIAEGWFVQIPLYLLSFFDIPFGAARFLKSSRVLKSWFCWVCGFLRICWEKKTPWLLMSKTSRDVKPFGGFSSVFCGRKKKPPFSGRGFGYPNHGWKLPPKGWELISKKTTQWGGGISRTRELFQNPGDVLVVDSQLILFTYYNTQDAEWMNHQINQRQLSMLVCASKTLAIRPWLKNKNFIW